MKIFDENTYCPKCHSPEILSRWMDKDLPYWKLPPDDKEKLEHIHRRCQRCGYWWNEAPIDSKKGYFPGMDSFVVAEILYRKRNGNG